MADMLRQVTRSEDFDEKRKTARLDVPIKVHYKVVGTEAAHERAETKNVSAGGCLLLIGEELAVNTDIELQIFLGDAQTESLTIRGRIIRLNRAQKKMFEYGIVFDEISKDARRLFADYFFAKMYEMIGLSEWPTDKRIKKG